MEKVDELDKSSRIMLNTLEFHSQKWLKHAVCRVLLYIKEFEIDDTSVIEGSDMQLMLKN